MSLNTSSSCAPRRAQTGSGRTGSGRAEDPGRAALSKVREAGVMIRFYGLVSSTDAFLRRPMPESLSLPLPQAKANLLPYTRARARLPPRAPAAAPTPLPPCSSPPQSPTSALGSLSPLPLDPFPSRLRSHFLFPPPLSGSGSPRGCRRRGALRPAPPPRPASPPSRAPPALEEKDETCPVSTGRKTRRVQLVRGEGRDVSS